MTEQPFPEPHSNQELSDRELLQQIKEDSAYLVKTGVAQLLIEAENKYRGTQDHPVIIDSLYFQIAQATDDRRGVVEPVVNRFQSGSREMSYGVQRVFFRNDNVLGLAQLSPEQAQGIRAIASSRPIQRGITREVNLLNVAG